MRIEIDDELVDRVKAQCPKYLSPTGFINLLIDQGLDRCATMWGKGERGLGVSRPSTTSTEVTDSNNQVSSNKQLAVSSSKEVSIKEVSNKRKAQKNYVFSVPPTLDQVKTELLEFWRLYKSGRKTRAAGGLLITGCQAILDNYGLDVLKEQIELASANNWQSITLKGYEQYGKPKPKPHWQQQEEIKHPAHRVFTAARGFEDEDAPVTNPLLKDLF